MADDPHSGRLGLQNLRSSGGCLLGGRLIAEGQVAAIPALGARHGPPIVAALHHFEENARFITQLKDLGVRVAIDDFGAGYTSFRNLQMLHVDTVKIDGSYVKDLSQSPENQVFVRTLVGLAKSFDIKTVAEWVGSDEDAALLQSFGVDYLQGFYFGEPVIDPGWDR